MTGEDDATGRGRAIRKRFEELGYGYRQFESLTGVGRKTLHRAMEGGSNDMTYLAIESQLSRLEARKEGKPVPMPRAVTEEHIAEGVVRIRLEGVFGVEAAIVEAPVDNPDALAAALDVIMRRMKQEAEPEIES